MPRITHNNLERTYRLHVPEACLGGGPHPLVFVLHGDGGTGKRVARITGFPDLADAEGFIVACPDGKGNQWNDDRADRGDDPGQALEDVDDCGFIEAIADEIAWQYPVDAARIYVAGASNGALMAYRLAREASGLFAAIGAVMGTLPVGFSQLAPPKLPMPAILIHGDADPIVPYEGGEIRVQGKASGQVLSFPETVRYWVAHNGCQAEPKVESLPETDDPLSMPVRLERYERGREGSEVEAYTITGGGHTWPGGEQYAGEWLIGKTCSNFNATQALWDFFVRHHRRG